VVSLWLLLLQEVGLHSQSCWDQQQRSLSVQVQVHLQVLLRPHFLLQHQVPFLPLPAVSRCRCQMLLLLLLL
jgi:hypothetical protein